MPPPGCNTSPTGTEAKEYRKYHPVPFYVEEQEPQVSLANREEEEGPVLSFTPVGKPFLLQGIDSDVVSLASLDTPLKKAIMDHVQDVTPQTEQSARTVGNYVRGSSKTQECVSEEDSYKSEDEMARKLIEDDEDVNLSEEEESFGDEYDVVEAEVVVLESQEESRDEIQTVQSPKHLSWEVQDAGESKGNDYSKSKNVSGNHGSDYKPKDNGRDSKSLDENQSGCGNLGGAQDDEKDDDDEDISRRKRVLPEDPTDDVEREEDTEEEPEITTSSTGKSSNSLSDRKRKYTRNPRKYKPSLEGSSPPKKRTPKTTPVEKMLEEDKERDYEVSDAFLHAFLLKVQTVTESRNPSLHNEFLKVLSESVAANESEIELLKRVQSLLKDYPELVAEFATFVDTDKPGTVEDSDFSNYQEVQAQVNFIRHLEVSSMLHLKSKFT